MSLAAPLAPGPMAEALKRNRETFNAKFALAQRAGARIDHAAFLDHLVSLLDPIIDQVASQFAEKVDATTTALYELSLELFTENLLGPQSRDSAISDAWRTLLPVIPRLLARDPRRVAASVTNAVHHIGQNEGARPAEWITRMTQIGPRCDDIQTFCEAGKVMGWLAGCPQYRGPALAVARSLPPTILASLFGFDSHTPLASVHKALDAMSANPWLMPPEAVAGQDLQRLRMVRLAGAFRGFAGIFLRPPIVTIQGKQFLVTDGEGVWILHADIYGCIFRRSKCPSIMPGKPSGPVRLSAAGELHWDNVAVSLPALAGWNSAAFDGQTMAVTLPTSHHVFLVARG